MVALLYNLLLILAFPLVFVYFLWRILVALKSNESWRENLGALPTLSNRKPEKKLIWLHAASVGEVMASLPLQKELRRLMPDAFILVTTMTQTGNAVARKSAVDADAVAYLPIDYLFTVNRALNRVRPDIIVIMEAELWPNFLWMAKKRGIPTVMANGRIINRTKRRGQSWRSWMVSNLNYCCMQTQVDARRIIEMGACETSVKIFGNMKFDQEGGKLSPEAASELRASLGFRECDPVFVAGSTNPGEEEPILSAFQSMKKNTPNLRLVIAPRQIERGGDIRTMAESLGFKCARRSEKDKQISEFDVLILDTFGELGTSYAVGELAFVGGTLIPKGGHSILQPLIQGKPVLFGPHTFKTRDIAQLAIDAGVGFQVTGENELAEIGGSLLLDAQRRSEIEKVCEKLVQENRGASARSAALVAELLESKTARQDG